MNPDENARRRLYGFIVFNIIEEAIIAIIAFVILFVFFPTFLIPGMIIVAIGLGVFTLLKIYSYWTSATIPVYDPLIGQEGISRTVFIKSGNGRWKGQVLVRGEQWKAESEEPITENTRIWVYGISGLTLVVGTVSKENQR